MKRITIIAAALLLMGAAEDPMLSVRPSAILVGGAVKVTCRVPRNPWNRSITYGFNEWSTSSHQLDGEGSRITWERVYESIPCNPGVLFCSVKRITRGKPHQEILVTVPFNVLGCN